MKESNELRWYLTTGTSIFERSVMGGILDKLENEAYKSDYCKRCAGTGILNKPWSGPDKYGITRSYAGGQWCPKCNGRGHQPVRMTQEEAENAYGGDWTCGDNEGTRATVGDAILVRYAYVSRVLSLMQPQLREALQWAYGDSGDTLSGTIHGRSWACAALTEPGKLILANERNNPHGEGIAEPERPILCLTTLAKIKNDARKHPELFDLLAKAAHDAHELLKHAEFDWDCTIDHIENGRKLICHPSFQN